MGRQLVLACTVLPVVLLLAACGGAAAPKPTHTHKTEAQSCNDLGAAVKDFYAIANPGSTVKRIDVTELPEPNGVRIPKPDCAFEMRPDPELVPGDVWTIENFYLDPQKGLDGAIDSRLVKAGYVLKPDTTNYSKFANHTAYSASILTFDGKDGQPYSKAADERVLDFTIGQG